MAYEISWYIPDHVIFVHYFDIVTKEDMQRSYSEISDLMRESPYSVHALLDSTEVVQMNFTVKQIKEILAGINFSETGWLINISNVDATSSRAHNFLISIVNQSLALRARSCKTLDEARHFLLELDNSLSDLMPA